MDKRKIIYNAVAGSGKTTAIIDKLNEKERSLVLTYTNNNEKELISRIIMKFGYIPENIVVKKVYSFLYSFCLKPYLPIDFEINGITYKTPNHFKYKSDNISYYLNSNKFIYNNKISKFILFNKIDFIGRLNKFFDNVFIDEFQDLSSDEINIAFKLIEFSGNVYLYGDFFQTTYSTSIRGNTNKSMKIKIDNFLKGYKSNGYEINTNEFIFSKRCPQSVTQFITNKLQIDMKSHTSEKHEINLLTEIDKIKNIMENDNIPKLFYQKANQYLGYSMNWGESKGLTFEDVCVVLNRSTFEKYNKDKLNELAPLTKNKFYVACTRTSRNLYFIEESKLLLYKKNI